jgi:anti-anti-sigma factor
MSNFTVETQNVNETLIVRPVGYVDDVGGAALCEAIQENLAKDAKNVVINFSKTPVINSQGIAQIIEIAEIVIDEVGGELAFVGMSELSKGVFKMVGLLEMAGLFETEEEAVQELS